MTLLLTEGWETYRGDRTLTTARGWVGLNAAPGGITGDSRTGTYSGYTGGTGIGRWRCALADEHATFIVGMAVRHPGGTNAQSKRLVALVGDAGVTTHIDVTALTDGNIQLTTGGVVRATTTNAPLALPSGSWTYVELKGVLSDTVGLAEIRLNGSATPILSYTGDTKNAGTKTVFDGFSFGGDINALVYNRDDIYCCNGAGTVNNDYLGDIRCYPLLPNGNGAFSQLVGSDLNSVDNYLLVDDGPGAADAAYVGSAVDGQRDSYVVGDLPAGLGPVLGLELVAHALKSDTGAKSLRQVIRIGGTDNFRADGVLGTSLTRIGEYLSVNPITTNPWTLADINGMEIGVEVRP